MSDERPFIVGELIELLTQLDRASTKAEQLSLISLFSASINISLENALENRRNATAWAVDDMAEIVRLIDFSRHELDPETREVLEKHELARLEIRQDD